MTLVKTEKVHVETCYLAKILRENVSHFRPKLKGPPWRGWYSSYCSCESSIVVSNSPFLCSWTLWLRNLGRVQLGSSCLGSLMKVKSDAD